MATSDLLARCAFPAAGTRSVCALSGGADSSALLALGVAADLDITAVHVHHGLRASADDDAAAAERIAHQLGVEFRCVRVDVGPGANLEERARTARLEALGPGAMTGHTADDQAETVLLNLMRGSGATGLAAMRPGPNHPILALRRGETEALCAELALNPVTDPTNRDPAFRRNRVRHELIPLAASIADRDLAPLLARSADLMRADDDLLQHLAREIDPTDARALADAPVALARRAVRRWLASGAHPPDAAGVERVLAVASGQVAACEVAGVGRIRRSGQRLHLEPH